VDLLIYEDDEGSKRRIATMSEWCRRRESILARMQDVMGPLPGDDRRVPLDVQMLEEVALPEGITGQEISYVPEEGDRVPAYLLVPNGMDRKMPAMLCLHQTVDIGKAEPVGLGKNPNLRYAAELAQRGYVTLSPDYPNFGDYQCDPYSMGYVSATMKGIWNHIRAVDLLQSLPQVDGERVGCIGHSLGGHNSMFLAVFDSRIKVIVSSCGFNSFFKYHGGDLSGWSHRGYMPRIASVYENDPAKMPFDFPEVVAALAPRPFFVNAPVRDSNFEVSGVRDCLEAAAAVYELLGAPSNLFAYYPDAGHEFPPEVRECAYTFIDTVLRP